MLRIFMKSVMEKKNKKVKKEVTLDDHLDRIIEIKKNENSALKKIYDSLMESIDEKK
jgi:hypothetical protein